MLGPARRVAYARGYTLLEILIVVALLGIASAVVIPQVGSTDVLRVQAAVRTLVADMTYAQSDALARQQTRAIVFDTVANIYTLVEVPGNTVEPTNNTMYSVNFNNNLKFHDARITAAAFAGQPTLLFDELGGPIDSPGSTTPGAGGVVTITGSGAVFDVTVEAYTGRVTVVKVSGP